MSRDSGRRLHVAAQNGTDRAFGFCPTSATRQSLSKHQGFSYPRAACEKIEASSSGKGAGQIRSTFSSTGAGPVKRSPPPGLFRNVPDPVFYGPQDLSESVL